MSIFIGSRLVSKYFAVNLTVRLAALWLDYESPLKHPSDLC
jgi:hypothetical protein